MRETFLQLARRILASEEASYSFDHSGELRLAFKGSASMEPGPFTNSPLNSP